MRLRWSDEQRRAIARRRHKGVDGIAREDIRAQTPVFAGWCRDALTLRGLMPRTRLWPFPETEWPPRQQQTVHD